MVPWESDGTFPGPDKGCQCRESGFDLRLRRLRHDESLARVDKVRVADLVGVGLEDELIARAVAVELLADAPKRVAVLDMMRQDRIYHDVRRRRRCVDDDGAGLGHVQ